MVKHDETLTGGMTKVRKWDPPGIRERYEMKEIEELREDIAELNAAVRRERLGGAMKSRWLNMKQACEYLATGRTTIYRAIQNGEIKPDGRVGSTLRFLPETLDRYITRGCDGQKQKEDAGYKDTGAEEPKHYAYGGMCSSPGEEVFQNERGGPG